MSDFRSKLLGLAAMATLFAGASYGQITACGGVDGAGNVSVTPGPTNLRAEGTSELTGDLSFGCASSGTTSTATITVFASAPVTSPAIVTAGKTEAILFVCAAGAPCTSGTGTAYNGAVSGTQIIFSGISLAGTSFNALIQNVRVNASSVAAGTGAVPTVTEQIYASANSTTQSTGVVTTGFVFSSLSAPVLTGLAGTGTPATTPYTSCAGNPAKTPSVSFAVRVGEIFGGAFKVGTSGANSEGGSYVSAPQGVATFGTRIQLVFSNIPTSATLYVPTSVSSLANGSSLILTLTASATGAFAPVAAATTTASPANLVGAAFNTGVTYASGAALAATNGTATAVYEVTQSNSALIQSTSIPVFVTFAANSITTVQPAITVLESYAPTAAATAATTVPNFAPPSNTALNGTTVNLCSTSLLFPFVTSIPGFDTGLALSNTSSDPFGTIAGAGTCNLNFYGTGAPTPSTGVAAPGGAQASGGSNAFLLSSVAPNFTGYMIASCNYQYGHGFAYIIYNFGQTSGATMGYLATVLNRVAGSTSEFLGQ